MDVIRPWIATRVTELLGFEDEVLINFIYGLLDGKVTKRLLQQIFLENFFYFNIFLISFLIIIAFRNIRSILFVAANWWLCSSHTTPVPEPDELRLLYILKQTV